MRLWLTPSSRFSVRTETPSNPWRANARSAASRISLLSMASSAGGRPGRRAASCAELMREGYRQRRHRKQKLGVRLYSTRRAMPEVAGPTLAVDLYSREAREDSSAIFAAIRAAGPATGLPPNRMWPIDRFDDVRAALRDDE